MEKNIKKRRSHNWKQGQSGNPNGRPTIEAKKKIEELFGDYTQEAIDCIVDIMRTETDSRARFLAAKYIVERVYGKIPEQVLAKVEHNGEFIRASIMEKLEAQIRKHESGSD